MRPRSKSKVIDGTVWCTKHDTPHVLYAGSVQCYLCKRERQKKARAKPEYRERMRAYGVTPEKRAKNTAYKKTDKGKFLLSMYVWIDKCEAVYSLGGGCADCGETDVTVLQFDHIRGDGHCEGDRRRGGKTTVSWILAHPEEAKDKYQVLCANCHMRKTAREAREGVEPCTEVA